MQMHCYIMVLLQPTCQQAHLVRNFCNFFNANECVVLCYKEKLYSDVCNYISILEVP